MDYKCTIDHPDAWHYAMGRYIGKTGAVYYRVIECMYTNGYVAVSLDDYEDREALITALKHMHEDVVHYPVVDIALVEATRSAGNAHPPQRRGGR
jgi:hypothetical protein